MTSRTDDYVSKMTEIVVSAVKQKYPQTKPRHIYIPDCVLTNALRPTNMHVMSELDLPDIKLPPIV